MRTRLLGIGALVNAQPMLLVHAGAGPDWAAHFSRRHGPTMAAIFLGKGHYAQVPAFDARTHQSSFN
jgi:hypothetical protein